MSAEKKQTDLDAEPIYAHIRKVLANLTLFLNKKRFEDRGKMDLKREVKNYYEKKDS